MIAFVLAIVLPTLAFGLLVWLPRLWRVIVDARRARARQLAPASPTIERLAFDLRRLRRQLEDGRHSRVQRQGALLAYLDLLVDACQRLDVPQDLRGCSGLAREAELMRVETALAAAGLDVRLPGQQAA